MPDAHSVRNSLTITMETAFGGNRAQFARAIGVTPPTVQAWLSGSRPTLRILLRLAAVTGSDLTSILEGIPNQGVHRRIALADDIGPERHRAVDWKRIETSLAFESEHPRPKSMKVFLREHGLDRTHLRRHELPEARELIERARQYRQAAARNRRDELIHRVELAAECLKASGQVASRRNMERELGPSVLRERALQQAWKRVR